MWYALRSSVELDELIQRSDDFPFVLFKHSTRCPLSSMVKRRFESEWDSKKIPVYMLDLLANRSLSNHVSSFLGVEHQSPQAILIQNKLVVWHGSHHEVDAHSISEQLSLN